ncbi:MAG TPA: hypothetical protein PLY40_08350, partial [Bacillota bacterium]|nr:hypothetical protein [Bacillota bacterium]
MENWPNNLAALVPCYAGNGGNCTKIYTLEGETVLDRRTVRWNLRRLARRFCIDLEAARSRYGELLDWRQGVPIPFSAALVLVPLKVRHTVGKNDGASGYFNAAAVEVSPGEGVEGFRSELLLPGGHRLGCCYTVRTVKKRLKAGQLLLKFFAGEAKPVAAGE